MAQIVLSQPGDSLEKAQADFDHFFSRIGYAVTRWAHIDKNLFELCNFALGSSREMTAAIFYNSPHLKEHLLLTDALLKYVLNKTHMKKWKAIFDSIDKHLPFRNDLAHNAPTQRIEMKLRAGTPLEFSAHPIEVYWEIITDETKLLHKKGTPRRAKKEDIVSHIKAVNQLLYEMRSLGKLLPDRRRLRQSKSSAPKSPALSDSKNNNRRSRTRHQPPPQSSQA